MYKIYNLRHCTSAISIPVKYNKLLFAPAAWAKLVKPPLQHPESSAIKACKLDKNAAAQYLQLGHQINCKKKKNKNTYAAGNLH